MKKLIALLLVLVMVFALGACASSEEASAEGSVYYLNFKPEADEAWQALAKSYTEQTGVEVKVVTAASGEYETTLAAQMGKDGAPTLFNAGNASVVEEWGDYCLDLTDADFVSELTTDQFNLYNEAGELKSVGYCYETYGIIVNTALLAEAGYSLDDITDFDSLKAVVEDIHANADKLGFDAFTASGLDDTSSWRFSGHLTSVVLHYEFADDGVTATPATITGAYMDNLRNIWDLYINNAEVDPAALTTSTGDEATAQFKEGKAVFYQNGIWEYAGLIEAGLKAEDLAMIPIYCGVDGEENAALCSGTENCWAVNAQASEADIKATLEFLNWVVTSEEGTKMLVEQFGAVPFKAAPESDNVFIADAAELLADGKYNISWAFKYTPNVESWRAGVVTALAAYSADQTDANWEAVVSACVDGWAIEYAALNG